MTEAEILAYRERKGIPRMSDWIAHEGSWRRVWLVEPPRAAALIRHDEKGIVYGIYAIHEADFRPSLVAYTVEDAKQRADAALRTLGWGPTDEDVCR
jgi:hypothetical protein